MKRLIAGLAIVAALFAGSAWNAHRLDESINALLADAETAETFAEQGDFSEAVRALRGSMEEWEKLERRARVFIHHTETDSVSDAYFEALDCLLSGDAGFMGSLERLRFHLSDLCEEEHVSWSTVF